MSNLAQVSKGALVESVVVQGDLSKLSPEQRTEYYSKVCSSLGLNPLTRPFDYITLNGRLTLYAKRDCTDQLRNIHNISVKIVSREQVGDTYVVTAQAMTPSGRTDESIGAVHLSGLKGDNLANALMKCETKAKRRVTLSICGLGLLDETEVDTVTQGQRKAEEVKEKLAQIAPHAEPEITEIEEPELLEDYVCRVGKNKGKRLGDIRPADLKSFIKWFDDKTAAGESMHPDVQEYAVAARSYLTEMEEVGR